jgi:hypothetical protein
MNFPDTLEMSHCHKQRSSKARSKTWKSQMNIKHFLQRSQIFQELKGNLTNMANTTGLANIKQQMTSNFTALVQNLEDLKNNTQFVFPDK